ncbi:glycosyltransferase family 2 protein [Halomonas sp. M5N1S17]|uniref:glycosyltransferase family A protein n=1 Tax=Halomonas alkalisoli TaxID=2907158 RepID=UPI001F4913AC|nr:glycosyltransferase family A protein [Halomonas alkalisoli]MCE9662751.1 glycosyltransferase family 2 protein [Halomonas alkalisoli]
MPFFTIVVPVHNKEVSLDAALSSAYQQTFRDFEVVAIDDCSTDRSAALLKRHEGKGLVRVYRRSTPGPGGYAARNHGVSQARADWVVFLDADDLLLPNHLQNFHEAIQENPDVQFLVNAYEKIHQGKKSGRKKVFDTGRVSRKEALAAFTVADFIHMNGVCMHKPFFFSIGGFPEGRFRRGGDVYLWLKALCQLEAIYYNEEVTSFWTMDSREVTRNTLNLRGGHPSVELLVEEVGELNFLDRTRLKAAVNRKAIAWAVEKKSCGLPVAEDVWGLSFLGLRPRQFIPLVSLILPDRLFKGLRLLRKSRWSWLG